MRNCWADLSEQNKCKLVPVDFKILIRISFLSNSKGDGLESGACVGQVQKSVIIDFIEEPLQNFKGQLQNWNDCLIALAVLLYLL